MVCIVSEKRDRPETEKRESQTFFVGGKINKFRKANNRGFPMASVKFKNV